MGWSSINVNFKSNNNDEIKNFLFNEFTSNNIVPIDYSKKGNTVYMAIKVLETGEVYAVVNMISFRDNEFIWKIIDETMGPYQIECPKRILGKLSPTDNEYANNWRKKCKEYHKLNSTKGYNHGQVLEFPNTISFTDGFKANKMILLKEGNRFRFYPYSGQKDSNGLYGKYIITKWKQRNPKVIGQI